MNPTWFQKSLEAQSSLRIVRSDSKFSQIYYCTLGTWQGSFAEVSKREYRIREKMEKIHCSITTHVNSRGLMTLYTDICGKFNVIEL